MHTISTLLLLILLLFVDIRACDGRRLVHVIKGSAAASSHHDLNQDLLKSPYPSKALREGSTSGGATAAERNAMDSEVPSSSAIVVEREGEEVLSGEVQGKFPGFHVDYVGPRTHPPAHN